MFKDQSLLTIRFFCYWGLDELYRQFPQIEIAILEKFAPSGFKIIQENFCLAARLIACEYTTCDIVVKCVDPLHKLWFKTKSR